MIKFECPACGEQLEAPDSLIGQSLKCPICKRFNEVPAPITERATKKTGNLLSRAWHSSPPTFRAGFLATMGGIAAILLSLWLYGNFFIPQSSEPANIIKPSQEINSSGTNINKTIKKQPGPSYEICKDFLESYYFYLDYQKIGILHGRRLMEHRFVYDANYKIPNISLWTDQDNFVIGTSAYWSVFYFEDQNRLEQFCKKFSIAPRGHDISQKTFEAFFHTTKNPFSINSLKFKHSNKIQMENIEEKTAECTLKTGFSNIYIQITYISETFKGKDFVKLFSATAQSW